MNTVGMRIKALRQEKGLSQSALAAATGKHKQYIAQAENGRRNPKWETLEVLAPVLGTTAAYLQTGIDAAPVAA